MMNKLISRCFRFPGLLVLVVVALVFRTFYGISVNFDEVNTLYLQDYTQIYLLGIKFYTSGVWPFWGPDITYTASQIPGALQALLVGLPFYVWESKEAPFVLLNLLSAASLVFFGWYISQRISTIPRWFVFGWLLTAPWTMNFSTTIINPSYVLAPAIVFFVSILELLPVYKKKLIGKKTAFFAAGLAIGWILQIHMSWVLLPFYLLLVLVFMLKSKDYRGVLTGVTFLGFGFLAGIATLIPTLLKFGLSTGNAESTIMFNPQNLKNIDIFLRFLSMSTADVRQFITGNLTEEGAFLGNQIWASPVVVFLFLAGLAQMLVYLVFLFRKSPQPEARFVKYLTLGTILLTYFSYLFAVREVATYTFYLLIPLSFWFGFYALEPLFHKAIWRKVALAFLLSGLVFHVALALEYAPKRSLFTKANMIDEALKMKDSRLFAYRRVAQWENFARQQNWRKEISIVNNDTLLTFSNSFDEYAPEILPESVVSSSFVSPPFACQVDSVNNFSMSFILPLKDLNYPQNISISINHKHSEANDCQATISIYNKEKSLYWSGEKIWNPGFSANEWNRFQLKKELPTIQDSDAKIEINVWLPTPNSTARILLDDFRIEFY